MNKFQWNLYENSIFFCQEICILKKSSILNGGHYVSVSMCYLLDHLPRSKFHTQPISVRNQSVASCKKRFLHYNDVIIGTIASLITSLTIVYSTVYSDADQRKHQSSLSLAFVRGIHRGPVNSPHNWSVTRKMFPFDDVIMRPPEISNQTLNSTST